MDEGGRSVRGYRFGVFELECASASLRKDGRELRLRGKPFDILLCLLEHPSDLVSRETLRQRLWGTDTFVDFDHGLNAAMNRLRDALGDTAENPRFIQTLPRRGYRFVAPVEPVFAPPPAATPVEASSLPPGPPAAATPLPTSRPRAGWKGGVAATVAAAAVVAAVAAGVTFWWRGPAVTRPMIAVLPFHNASGSPDQDYFSDGFTEELIAQLGGLNPEALGVIARSTVARYRDSRQSVNEIGRALNVQYVLEGSVRRRNDRVRITAQLIDVASQTQLWAESYDHDVRDVLMAQRDVAMRVADSLTMSVLRVAVTPRMPSAEAYDATLRGRALRLQATESSLSRAQEYFEQAIALDPTYAPAHAGLADVYHMLGGPGWEIERPRELLLKAQTAARRAIDLDPRQPHGYAVRGMTRLWLDGDVAGAEEDIRRAISLNASFALAHQYLSTVLVVSGRPAEAILSARRALQLDPLAPSSGTTFAYRLYYGAQYAEALREFDRALEGSPDYSSAWLGKSQTLRALGRLAEARSALDAAERHSGGRWYIRAYRGYALGVDGDRDGARAIQAELVAMSAMRYVSPFHLALVAAGLGDGAEVRRQLALLSADGSGWTVFVPLERELAPFRTDGSRESR